MDNKQELGLGFSLPKHLVKNVEFYCVNKRVASVILKLNEKYDFNSFPLTIINIPTNLFAGKLFRRNIHRQSVHAIMCIYAMLYIYKLTGMV